LTIDGGSGSSVLYVNDQANSAGSLLGWNTAYTVTNLSLTRTISNLIIQSQQTSTIHYSNLVALTLNASNSANTANVESTATQTATTTSLDTTPTPTPVYAATGTTTIKVNTPSLHDALPIYLTIDGGSGSSVLYVNDQANSAGALLGWSTTYTVTNQSLTRT